MKRLTQQTLGEEEELSRAEWAERYRRVRAASGVICAPLAAEDYVIQAAVEASPAKWHLAHVSWFFETFILCEYMPGYQAFNPAYRSLFNSYYEQVGEPFSRGARGTLSRPTVEEVYRYRGHVDEYLLALLEERAELPWPEILQRLEIGLNHEQQHQELLLTDIKRNFYANPLRPVYRDDLPLPPVRRRPAIQWLEFEGGVRRIGHVGEGFSYDNESPRHNVYLQPFRLASRPVTNGEFLAFIESGGYRNPALWLSDGWARLQQEGWNAPLYWERQDGEWWHFTLGGMAPLNPDEPVCHVSHYEAAAYAAWAGCRLPTEAEWEVAAEDCTQEGNLRETGYLQPIVAPASEGLLQLYGDVWEHTASAYLPYPGYRAAEGALGEYNGKFMCNQMVLRGGSCVTPADHIRPSYRNFFYPQDRWQFQGFRLADDL